ncbi:MAG: helix-turn-helix transcriptional regulator [Lachnospiraceae bacterium]|nr:helix-turn-helix transcriptional regulator [Lachnospiraceae bacterium]
MEHTLELLKQLANGLAKQFGPDCEIVIHDLQENLEHSVVHIVNGHVSNRKTGDGPSRAVLNAIDMLEKNPDGLKDQLAYLTRTANGKILKSSTMYIRDEAGKVRYLLAMNYDISGLMLIDKSIKAMIETESDTGKNPEQIINNVQDLLDLLIQQSVELVGKPVPLMNKDDKMEAIRFLSEKGAFLITKSGDKVSKYFGISKYTLYSYIDLKKKNAPQES